MSTELQFINNIGACFLNSRMVYRVHKLIPWIMDHMHDIIALRYLVPCADGVPKHLVLPKVCGFDTFRMQFSHVGTEVAMPIIENKSQEMLMILQCHLSQQKTLLLLLVNVSPPVTHSTLEMSQISAKMFKDHYILEAPTRRRFLCRSSCGI